MLPTAPPSRANFLQYSMLLQRGSLVPHALKYVKVRFLRSLLIALRQPPAAVIPAIDTKPGCAWIWAIHRRTEW